MKSKIERATTTDSAHSVGPAVALVVLELGVWPTALLDLQGVESDRIVLAQQSDEDVSDLAARVLSRLRKVCSYAKLVDLVVITRDAASELSTLAASFARAASIQPRIVTPPNLALAAA